MLSSQGYLFKVKQSSLVLDIINGSRSLESFAFKQY